MKYVPPIGAIDPEESYIDGNPVGGIEASALPAAAVEDPQREIVNVIHAASIIPDDENMNQLYLAILLLISQGLVFSPTTAGQPTAVDTVQEGLDAAFTNFWTGSVLAPHRNLVVKQTSAATVDVDAAEVVLTNAAGASRRFQNIDLTANVTVAGVNGRDTGAEAASTWYHIWVVAKRDGTVAALLSASATAPTMPADYTFKGYMGAVYNNASSNFVAFYQRNAKVNCPNTPVLSAGNATSWTPVSLAAALPPTATEARLRMAVSASSGATVATGYVTGQASGSTLGDNAYGYVDERRQTGTINEETYQSTELLLTNGLEVKYMLTGTNAIMYINATGWRY